MIKIDKTAVMSIVGALMIGGGQIIKMVTEDRKQQEKMEKAIEAIVEKKLSK